ncbi:armadillo-like helical domain-containing protein [Heterostelium album PN500]|uniref:Armadillo-like helical domain-containing protein n=1 Tax=Heterostelium pallidum (strain ATCC 26659 / Pp 5 / PN500) TaxID=670386 RepID=D3BT25_HETP5|nr:armadillo-like helical domain-containing protein [Heterostelium album PN500]EFA75242.1 armadillo-like helical domain-containing protein [Heterostelium album PN500]|eukprot:XP_020427376.1 armadillo-like helical domain-containing protein [Heterostelium album PN500]
MSNKRKGENDNDVSSKYTKIVDQVSDEVFEELNQNTLKKLVLSFEKKYNNNQEMRLKYSKQPEKSSKTINNFKIDYYKKTRFMDSEIELYEEIKKLQIIATAPELYPLFIKLGSVTSLGSLLLHDNTDIVIDTIDLFQELTAQESPTQDESLSLTNSIFENGILEVLVQQTFDKLECSNPDEQQAVHNILNIFENLLEVKPLETSKILVDKSNVFKYILDTISNKSTPLPIRLYCCEILSIILQEYEESRTEFGKKDGIERLLIVISAYKKKSPESLEESEMVENIFSSLCSCLFNHRKNKELFIKSEGIELMLLFIKNKTTLRSSALKVFNYALSDDRVCCERFVDQLGLKTLFSSLMKKVKSKHNKKVYNESEDEEHIITTIFSLLFNLEKRSERYNRVVSKFTENQFEKIDRCFELIDKYTKRLVALENDLKQEEDEYDEDELFLKRIDADTSMKQKNISKNNIRQVLIEYRDGLDDTTEEKRKQIDYIRVSNQMKREKPNQLDIYMHTFILNINMTITSK